MAFFIASSPHTHNRRSTRDIMKMVSLCTLPGVAALCYFFGWGVLVQISIASVTALVAEAVVMKLRNRSVTGTLSDYSALLTGVLIGIAIPPLAPWWIAIIGALFAIVIGKQLYGGLGQNLFNPAMIAYVVLLISFPLQMTTWVPPHGLAEHTANIADVFSTIFTGFTVDGFSANQLRMSVDGVTMATPLDTIKTSLTAGKTVSEA